MKRIQRPTTPTVRALPPQRTRLIDTPGLLPILRVAAASIVATLVLGGASLLVVGVARGTVPPIVVPLVSLTVLAATAGFFAGRNQGQRSIDDAASRKRAKGRLAKGGTPTQNVRAEAGMEGATAGDLHAAAGAVLRTKFLDDISQSLRAPITSICLAARIIRKHFDTTPEVVAHFGDTLLAEADRLGQIVDEFLELARLESGLVEWVDRDVDAADLIERAVAEVEPLAVSYGVSVAFTLEPGLPSIEVDRDRAAQALTILLALAVRSASEGSEIVIQIAGAHGGWVFSVGGTSFVYPHAEARKVAARGDAVATLELEGKVPEHAGLSLCLAREIVARYQGRVWIEGAPGAHGCMRFTVPYKHHRRAVAAAPAEQPSAQEVTQPVAELDLEERRARAAKLLEERASIRPPSAQAPADQTAAAPPPPTPASSREDEREATPNAESAPARVDKLAVDQPPASATVSEDPKAETKTAPTRPKISFAHSGEASPKPQAPRGSRAAEPAAPASPLDAPSRRRPEATEVSPAATASPPDADVPLVEATLEDAVEMEPEIVDDTPVRAPVSGTMISAHHRTAGPPVLAQHAHPGVPALSGVQSAANAAMQGSDDLLIEIAEAQSADGRALVVSDEVRNLLSSAPENLPAVANHQNVPSTRASYTPSRRRMVQAPWVVRSQADEAPADAGNASAPAAAAPPAARPRLSDRLAKRLGISENAGGTRAARSESRSQLLRSRRLG